MTSLLDNFYLDPNGVLLDAGKQSAQKAYARAGPPLPFEHLSEASQTAIYAVYVTGLQDALMHVSRALIKSKQK